MDMYKQSHVSGPTESFLIIAAGFWSVMAVVTVSVALVFQVLHIN